MSNENSTSGSLPQAVPETAQERNGSLYNLLNDGPVPLPESVASGATEVDAQTAAETVILQVEELLVSQGDGSGLEGGFLLFDRESSPGNTVIKVVLDGVEEHQVFEFGTFKGAEMDLNSLLGLAGPDSTNPG